MVAKGERRRGGMNWEVGIVICTLLYVKWIITRDVLCSTGNYAQYSVITCIGKESEREWMYEYVWLNHFAVHVKLA